MDQELSDEIKAGLRKEVLDRSNASAVGQILLLSTFYLTNHQEISTFPNIVLLIVVLFINNVVRFLLVKFKLIHSIKIKNLIDVLIIFGSLIWGLIIITVLKDIGFNSFSGIMIYLIGAGISAASTTSVAAIPYLLNLFLFFTIAIPGFFSIYYFDQFQLKMIGVVFLIYSLFLKIQGVINRKNIISKIKINIMLNEEKKHIENILNAVPGKIVYLNASNKQIYCNMEWTNAPIETQYYKQYLLDFDYNKQIFKTNDISVSDSDFYLLTISRIENENNKLIHFLNINELKKAEKEVESQKIQLINSARLAELGEMAGSIAHEINNPLTILNGKIRIANRHLTENDVNIEKLRSDIASIELVSERISKIVKGMKSVMRNSESDQFITEYLTNIISDTILLCEHRFSSSSIEFKYINLDKDIRIRCKPSQISQVIFNLLSNAIDAIDTISIKWITLEITSDNKNAFIRVTDSGCGIPDEVKNKIFNPFFTTKEIGKGTGLGLSIGHKIITTHHGEISLDEKNINTSFLITIPKICD